MLEFPPKLISRAKKILHSNIQSWEILGPRSYDWLRDIKVVWFIDSQGNIAIFGNKKKEYFRLNCKEGIRFINKILEEYTFKKDDFNCDEKIESFLTTVVQIHSNPRSFVSSKKFLHEQEKWKVISKWMLGTEKNEDVFRQLCFNPYFVFDGDNWEVKFNVFTVMGSVDQWRILGKFNSKRRILQIDQIEITNLKEKGTFFYSMIG